MITCCLIEGVSGKSGKVRIYYFGENYAVYRNFTHIFLECKKKMLIVI